MELFDIESTRETRNINTPMNVSVSAMENLSLISKTASSKSFQKAKNVPKRWSAPTEPCYLKKSEDFSASDQLTSKFPSLISVNVGGLYFTTWLSTLCKYPDSMLAAMFSGRYNLEKDSKGAYFIDRNGTYFGFILDFLRSEVVPPNDVSIPVLYEARYYGLTELEDRMSVIPAISSMIVKENHRAQFPDYQEFKRKIVQIAMENATVSKVGEVLIYAFRQEFIPKAPNFNVNHNCSTDQAHISIGPWDSIADEETLIKCLESDLIEEEFKVKVHEGKRRCKYFYGQSCQKCVFRIQISFC